MTQTKMIPYTRSSSQWYLFDSHEKMWVYIMMSVSLSYRCIQNHNAFVFSSDFVWLSSTWTSPCIYNAVFAFGFYSREITDVSHASTRTLILAFSPSLTLFKRTLSNIVWLTCVARHIHVSFDDLDTVSRSQGHQTCIHIRLQVIFDWISRSQLWQKIENESCSVYFV